MRAGIWKLSIGATALAACGVALLAVVRPAAAPDAGVAAGRGRSVSDARLKPVAPGRVPGATPPSLVGSGSGAPRGTVDPMRGSPAGPSSLTGAAPVGSLGSQPGVAASAPRAEPPAPPVAAAPQDRVPAAPPVTSAPPSRLPSAPAASMTASPPPAGTPDPMRAASVTGGGSGFIEEEAPGESTPVLVMENGENDTMWLVLYGRSRFRAEVPPLGTAELRVDPGTYTVKTWTESYPQPNVGQGLFRAHRRYRARFVLRPSESAAPLLLGELLDRSASRRPAAPPPAGAAGDGE